MPIGASHAYANFKPKTPSRSLGDVSQPLNQRATPPPQSVGRVSHTACLITKMLTVVLTFNFSILTQSSRIPMKSSRCSPHPDHARQDTSQSQKRPKMKEPARTPCVLQSKVTLDRSNSHFAFNSRQQCSQ